MENKENKVQEFSDRITEELNKKGVLYPSNIPKIFGIDLEDMDLDSRTEYFKNIRDYEP